MNFFYFMVADFIVKFKWAIRSNKEVVYVKYTKKTLCVLELFLNEGCIRSFFVERRCLDSKVNNFIKVNLLYVDNASLIKDIVLVSKCSNRKYFTFKYLYAYMNKCLFQGFYVVSTVEGLKTSNSISTKRLVGNGVAGEVLLKVVY